MNAVCITGLERTFDAAVARNIRASVLAPLNTSGELLLFGVQPINASWNLVRQHLPIVWRSSRVALQAPCLARGAPLPAWYTCAKGGAKKDAGRSCVANFVQELCDLAACEALLRRHEARARRRFGVVARLRLDLVWEAPITLPLPSIGAAQLRNMMHSETVVELPKMNGQSGFNDKFAVGGRRGMAAYLRRVELLEAVGRMWLPARHGRWPRYPVQWRCSSTSRATGSLQRIHPVDSCEAAHVREGPSGSGDGSKALQVLGPGGELDFGACNASLPAFCGKIYHAPGAPPPRCACHPARLSSEAFLRYALWRRNATVRFHQSWMYCKFGVWPQCTQRLLERRRCDGGGLVCRSWRSTGGCQCVPSCANLTRWSSWCVNVSADAPAALA